MAEYIFITEDIRRWFWPLLPDAEQRRMEQNTGIYAIGAVEGTIACGVLLFEFVEQIAQIDYLIVADEYRRRGIGIGMVRHLCKIVDGDVIPVICGFAASGMEAPIYQFFADMWNFSLEEEEGYYCRVPLSGVKENELLASMKGKGAPPEGKRI